LSRDRIVVGGLLLILKIDGVLNKEVKPSLRLPLKCQRGAFNLYTVFNFEKKQDEHGRNGQTV
jgi:hypothetical protein